MQGIYEFLLLLSTSATLWLYLLCALAAWRMKVVRGFALVGAAYALWTLWGAGLEATGWSMVLAGAGVPLYLWTRRGQAASACPARGRKFKRSRSRATFPPASPPPRA